MAALKQFLYLALLTNLYAYHFLCTGSKAQAEVELKPIDKQCYNGKFAVDSPYHQATVAAVNDVLDHANSTTYYRTSADATDEDGYRSTVYAEGFCAPTLTTPGECTFCLQELGNKIYSQCGNAFNAHISNLSCSLRYGLDSFDTSPYVPPVDP